MENVVGLRTGNCYHCYCYYSYFCCYCFSYCRYGAARAPSNPSNGGVGALANAVAIAAAVGVRTVFNSPRCGIRAVGAANSIAAEAHGNGSGPAVDLFEFRYLWYHSLVC